MILLIMYIHVHNVVKMCCTLVHAYTYTHVPYIHSYTHTHVPYIHIHVHTRTRMYGTCVYVYMHVLYMLS